MVSRNLWSSGTERPINIIAWVHAPIETYTRNYDNQKKPLQLVNIFQKAGRDFVGVLKMSPFQQAKQ